MIDPAAKVGTSLLSGKKASETYGTSLLTGMTEAQIRLIKQLSERKPGESLIKWAARVHRSIGGLP